MHSLVSWLLSRTTANQERAQLGMRLAIHTTMDNTMLTGLDVFHSIPCMGLDEMQLMICIQFMPFFLFLCSRYSHVHVRFPGSGVHIPIDVHVAVILVDGTNIGLHMNNITAPSVVF